MEITKGELKLISRLLEMAGNEFSNHGCNDMDQALWDEIGFTPEDRATLIHEMQLWNGDTKDPYPTKLIHMRDDMVMNFYAHKLKTANLAGSPAPTPPLDVARDAARYWRLRLLGCAPVETKQLENGTVLRFSNLDEFVDHDIKIHSSRGEAELYERRHIASPAPQLKVDEPCPTCERRYLGNMGPGEYSCVSCGMGLNEPCEHWKKMLAENDQLDAASPAQPEKRDEWVSVEESGLPKVGHWCWVVYHGAVQRMAAHLAGKGFSCADGYEWRWADDSADPCPLEEITHWQPLPAPPQEVEEFLTCPKCKHTRGFKAEFVWPNAIRCKCVECGEWSTREEWGLEPLAAPVVSAPDMTAAEHLKQCCACNHGRTPCIEYQRNWPVVSTAAPEPSKRDRAIPRTVSLVTCANCDAQVPPAAAGCIRCGANLMIKNSASETPVAPESYKPAEGPGLITRLRYMGGRLRSELNDAAMLYPTCFHLEAVQQMIAEWDEIAKEAVKTEMAAATPVTVEAPPVCPPAETFVDNFLRGNLWLSAEHEFEKRDAIAVLLKNYAKHLLATPKPIGDVEAVAEQIAGPVLILARGMTYEGFREHIKAILSPFFAPGPEISADAIRHLVDCVHIGLNGSVSAHEGFGNSSCIACIVGLKLAANGTAPAQPPCSECATLQKQRESDLQHMQSEVSAAHSRVESAEAQLSTLRDALEREKLAAELFSRHRMRNNGRTRNEAAQLPMWQLMSAYERQNWLDTAADVQNIISAALAPTPEVAPKE